MSPTNIEIIDGLGLVFCIVAFLFTVALVTSHIWGPWFEKRKVPADIPPKAAYNVDDRVKVVNHSHFYDGATGTVRKWKQRSGYLVWLDKPHDCSGHFQPWSLEPFVDEEAA